MQTLPQIIKDHIERKLALGLDGEALVRDAKAAEMRLRTRLASDPSLHMFISHYAEGILGAMPMFPDALRPAVMRSFLAQVITEWEDVNIEFENQLKMPQ